MIDVIDWLIVIDFDWFWWCMTMVGDSKHGNDLLLFIVIDNHDL